MQVSFLERYDPSQACSFPEKWAWVVSQGVQEDVVDEAEGSVLPIFSSSIIGPGMRHAGCSPTWKHPAVVGTPCLCCLTTPSFALPELVDLCRMSRICPDHIPEWKCSSYGGRYFMKAALLPWTVRHITPFSCLSSSPATTNGRVRLWTCRGRNVPWLHVALRLVSSPLPHFTFTGNHSQNLYGPDVGRRHVALRVYKVIRETRQ